MITPGRSVSSGSGYRYGFQGQEQDNEVKGEGNSINFSYRVHDPRLGRFLSLDPLASQFPHNSPYAFAENKVLQFVELEGGEIALPRLGPIQIPEITITLPKAPTMPIPPTPPPIIPQTPNIPHTPAIPQTPTIPKFPINPTIKKSIDIDESTIDPNDATTYPTPPFPGNWRVEPIKPGTKGYEKGSRQGATRLENESGDVTRWHKSDRYHPKGHWDLKRGGNPNNPWENYTPDGVRIPDGMIYGRDFNPVVLPSSTEKRGSILDALLKSEYYKKLNEYNKKMEQYKKDKAEYDKQLEQMKKEHPEKVIS